MGSGRLDVRAIARVALRVAVALAYLVLAWRGLVPWWFVLVLALRDLALVVTLPSLRSRGPRAYPVHEAGSVAVGMLAAGAAGLGLSVLGGSIGDLLTAVGWACAAWGAYLSWVGAVVYIRQLAELLAASPRVSGAGVAR